MTRAIPPALMFLCTLPLGAQITTKMLTLPNGATEVRLRNASALNLDAFAIRVSYVTSSSPDNTPVVIYIDTQIDVLPSINRYRLQKEPLAPGEEFATVPALTVAVNNRTEKPLFQQPIITAGIFSDGSTTGDKTLLAGLLLRRCNMLLAVETALETLSEAGNRNVPRQQLIDQFQKMAGSVRRAYLPVEQRVGLGLYQSMISKLMNLPEVDLGSPFPPSTFVSNETAVLRRHRAALIESQPNIADLDLIRR